MSMQQILSIVWRRKAMVFAIVLLALAASVTFYAKTPPQFQATALLLVGQESSDRSPAGSPQEITRETQALALIANTDSVLGKVIAKVGLDKLDNLSSPSVQQRLWERLLPSLPPFVQSAFEANAAVPAASGLGSSEIRLRQTIAAMRRKIKATADDKSGLLQISYRNGDATLAAEVLNTLVDVLIQRQSSLNNSPEALLFVEEQKQRLDKQAVEANLALSKFVSESSTYPVDEQRDLLLRRASDVATSLTQTRGSIARATGQKQSLTDHMRKLRGVANSPLISEVVESIGSAKAAAAAGDLTIQNQRAPGDAPLLMVRVYQEGMLELLKIDADLAGLTKLESHLGEELSGVNKELNALYQREAEFRQLQRAVAISSAGAEIYGKKLIETKFSADLAKAKLSEIKIVQPASIPDEPVFPTLAMVLLFGTAAGVFAGMGAAVLAESISAHSLAGSVSSPRSVRRRPETHYAKLFSEMSEQPSLRE